MDKKMNRTLATIFISFMLAAAFAVPAYASIGFSANARLPENQKPGTTAYFDLVTQPGQTQELSVMVSNESEEEITVVVEAYTSTTSRSGNVVYVPSDNLAYTPKHLITDMIHVPESTITIPAQTEREVSFTLVVPDEPFDGIVLGSVRVLKALSEEELSAGGIINQYAFSIPIRLSQNDNEVAPDFYLESVEAELVHFSASVVCNIVNTSPRLIKGMSVFAEVFPEGSDTPIMQHLNEETNMAPESLMQLTIGEQLDEGFESGKYTVKLALQYEGKEWNFEEPFEITDESASTINERIVVHEEPEEEKEPLPTWVIVLLIAGAVVIIIVVIAVILFRKHVKKYNALLSQMDGQVGAKSEEPSEEAGKNE